MTKERYMPSYLHEDNFNTSFKGINFKLKILGKIGEG